LPAFLYFRAAQAYTLLMNIFVIPAWYPTADAPLTGLFIKEQLEAFAKQEPGITIGIGLWGQLDNRYLLYVKDHIRNLQKIRKTNTESHTQTILPNLKEYHTPTFTWTRKLLHGNKKNILKALVANYNHFETEFGKVNLIHAQIGEIAGHLAMELAQLKQVPYLLTEHMGPFPGPLAADKKGKLKPYYLKPYLKAAVNVATSPFQQQEMEHQQIPRIATIPNIINENFFKPGSGKPPQEFTFFTLARLTPEKGIDQLLQAFRLVIQTNPTIKLRVGGSGLYFNHLQQLASKLYIAKSITWLGELNREQTLQEYQHCNAFVLPSLYECFGLVYAEAIACGKPLIATRCGGPESIVNSLNGLLVDKGDINGLARAMTNMIANYNQYNSELIREDFMNRFSGKAVIPQLVHLYNEISTQHFLRNQ